MSNEQKIIKIADWLEKQILDSTISDGTIRNNLKLSRTSFYRLKPKAVIEVNQRSQERQTHLGNTIPLQRKR